MINPVQKKRTRNVFIILALCMTGLLVRVYDLQCLRPEVNQKRAIRQHKMVKRIPARRGRILDRNGKILAITTTRPSLWCDPGCVMEPQASAVQLARILNESPAELYKKITHPSRRFVWIAKEISDTQAQKIKQLRDSGHLNGIFVKQRDHRMYPKGELCGNLLGLCNAKGEGAEGLEYMANTYLSGRDGYFVTRRDSKRREFYDPSLHTLHPEDGYDIYLTIDEYIQHVAERELMKVVEEETPERAIAIIQRPKTGEILALVQWPSLNPNRRDLYKPGVYRNYAATDYFEPGSTMKAIAGAIALDTGAVNLHTNFFCENGHWQVTPGHILHDDHPLDTADFKNIIKHSSNIGMAKIARMVDVYQFHEYLKRFGFGTKTEVPFIPLESSGLLRPPYRWTELSMVSIPIGHEIGVTALQLVSAISTIANKGTRVRPSILEKIVTENSELIPEAKKFNYFEPEVVEEKVISEDTANTMIDVLVSVTDEDGTGHRAAIPGYNIAGKTGTAQKYDREIGAYSRDNFVASFVGFVPAEDPEICVVVIIDSPQKKHYGGQVAAPVFREICEETLSYLNVPKKEGKETIPASATMHAQLL